jgi:hypothetical protein
VIDEALLQKGPDGRMAGLSVAAQAVGVAAAPLAEPRVSNDSEMQQIGEPGRTVPDRPSGYRILMLPGGPALEQQHVEEVTRAVHAVGYSQGDLDALVFARQIAKHEMGNGARVEQASKKSAATLRSLWGDQYDANMALAKAEARALGASSPLLNHEFENTTMGSNVQVIKKLFFNGQRRQREG